MNKKDIFKTLIAQKQSEMPFSVIDRDVSLPIDRNEIITVPGVRRCGKSTLMEIAINRLLANVVMKENVLWIGFDDERIKYMTAEELDLVLQAYREMYPATELKDVWMFFDELPLVKDWEYFVLRLFKGSCKHTFICGSNASTLSVEMKSALRGWPHEIEVWPLSFREFLRFKGIDADSHLEQDKARVQVAFDEYNRLGGMPETDLYVGTREIAFACVEEFEKSCETSGIKLHVHEGLGMMHCWGLYSEMKEGRKLQKEYFDILRTLSRIK